LRLLLDTTVLIDVLRGRPAAERVRALRDTGQAPWVCAVNAEEVLRGAKVTEEAIITRFLSGMRLARLDLSEGKGPDAGAGSMQKRESPSAKPTA
jgi:predicted nucleic acid-binding protein